MNWSVKENTRLMLAASSVLSAAAGAGVAYVLSTKLLQKKFQEIADAEIQEAKVYYQGLYSRPTLIAEDIAPDEEPLIETLEDLTREAKSRLVSDAASAMKSYMPPAEPESPVIVNVFAHHTAPSDEVLGALMADRNPEEPYIITKEEFYQNDPENEQKQFTFYEGDSILVDDQDEYNPIQDTEKVVGDDNLLRFGYGSGDEHTLYIRNETLDPPMDLYITRSLGRYTDEVMGFNDDEPHLKHSQRRFRIHDE